MTFKEDERVGVGTPAIKALWIDSKQVYQEGRAKGGAQPRGNENYGLGKRGAKTEVFVPTISRGLTLT